MPFPDGHGLCFAVSLSVPAGGDVAGPHAALPLLLGVGPVDLSVVEANGFGGKISACVHGDSADDGVFHLDLHELDFFAACPAELYGDVIENGTAGAGQGQQR